jgi:2-hydroxyacyl-CoA lyase 1
MPKNSILSAEGAGTMDIGLTMLPVFSAKACLNAGTYGTMGLGLGQAIAAAIVHPDRPVIHLSGDSAIGFSGMEMETLCRYNLPVKIVVLNNGGIGPGMPEIPENPMMNMRPNSLIYGARYDKVMEAFGGKGFFVEDPKDIKGALDEAMNHRGPALVNIVLSQGSARKPSRSLPSCVAPRACFEPAAWRMPRCLVPWPAATIARTATSTSWSSSIRTRMSPYSTTWA